MARVTRHSLLRGISGKLGPLVVRQVGDQTIVQAAEAGPCAPRSPARQAHLARMYQAQLYAKAQIRDPAAKARYAARIDQRRTSAYTGAIADYLNPPVITALDARRYHGQPNAPIYVSATDDFAVASVHLSLYDATAALLETGPATLLPDGRWRYLTQVAHPTPPGTRLEAEARAYPGNVARHSTQL